MDKIIKLSRKEGIASPQKILEIMLLFFLVSPCDLGTKRETREIKGFFKKTLLDLYIFFSSEF